MKKNRGMISAFAGPIMVTLLAGLCQAAEKTELKTESEKINYSVGYQIGGDFQSQGVELDRAALVRGIEDAIGKNKPLLTQEEMNSTLVALKKKIVADQQEKEKRTAAENRKAGAAFLEENAKQKDVVVLPSGVQYRILKQGTGKKPSQKDDVTVHYRITRVDGKELTNTFSGGAPRTSAMSKAIPALQEVLPLMAEGSRWQIVIPPLSHGGSRDRDPLDDMGVMIYELELVSVKTP